MVYPYLRYCNVVWASTYPSRLDALYKEGGKGFTRDT